MFFKGLVVCLLIAQAAKAQVLCHGLFAAFYLKTHSDELARSAEDTYRQILTELGSSLGPSELEYLAKNDPYELSSNTSANSHSLQDALSDLKRLVREVSGSAKNINKIRSRLKEIAGQMQLGMIRVVKQEEKNSLENLNGKVTKLIADLKFLKTSPEGNFISGILNGSTIVVVDGNGMLRSYDLGIGPIYTPIVSEEGRLYFAAEKKLYYADLLNSDGILKTNLTVKLFQQDEKFIGHGTLSLLGDGQTLMQDWLSSARFFTKEGIFVRGVEEMGARFHLYEPAMGANYLLRFYTNGHTEQRTLAALDLTDSTPEPERIPLGKKRKSVIQHVWVAVPGKANSEIHLVVKDRYLRGGIEEPELYRLDIKTQAKRKMELLGPLNKKNEVRTFRRFVDIAVLKSKDTVLFSGYDVTLGDDPLQKIFYLLNPITGQSKEFNLISKLQDSADAQEFFAKNRGEDFQIELLPGTNYILIWNNNKTLYVRVDISEYLSIP